MKKMLINILPKNIQHWVVNKKLKRALKNEFEKDYRKFLKHAFIFTNNKVQKHYEADLIFYYHKIEKGLALPQPKIEFGKKNILYLINVLDDYVSKFGWDDTSLISLNVLMEYYEFNKKNSVMLDSLYKDIRRLKETVPDVLNNVEGGTLEKSKSDINSSNIDFKKFALSRHSIRDFSTEKVEIKLIQNAVEIAQKTPSVCNRQSSKVYVFSESEDKRAILELQNGNAGFGSLADKVILITIDLRDFRGVIERNQAYIDGGMYSMSLIYGLHAQGLGTCPLNLSITNDTEEKLKRVAGIPESELLLMMVAVGHIPEKLKVAWSPRRKVEEVITIR